VCWHGSTDKYYCTQGADDNTSGVVGCLALVKLFKDKALPFNLKVAFFDGEEPGMFIERLGMRK
jgi:Zn-dependent M28 family amino/carboxypeptidase